MLSSIRLDDLCRPPSGKTGSTLPFHLIGTLYEHSALIFTPNWRFPERASVLGDAKMATALRDQPTHPCRVVEIGNDGLRFKNRSTIH